MNFFGQWNDFLVQIGFLIVQYATDHQSLFSPGEKLSHLSKFIVLSDAYFEVMSDKLGALFRLKSARDLIVVEAKKKTWLIYLAQGMNVLMEHCLIKKGK